MWLLSKCLRLPLLVGLIWLASLGSASLGSVSLELGIALADEPSPLAENISSLPASLAQWYRPANKRQVWLHSMFALRRELQAVTEYSQEGDWPLAAKWGDRLGKHYLSLAEMVPEWQDELDLVNLERMQQALAQQDAEQLRPALRRLEQSCQGCHGDYSALAAARYRGPDFHGLQLNRPEQAPMAFNHLMEQLSLAVNRIKIASEDDRWDAAEQALGQLKGHLNLLQTSCTNCHGKDEAPIERILLQPSRGALAELAESLKQQDPKSSGRYLGQASVEICARCHGVHRSLYELNRFLFD
jgi:mono/diheme cytochrome c family protein